MINRIVLVGRLTKEVELRYTPSGVAMARFTLAVNRTFSNSSGEKEADFINCIVWRKQAENIANFLKKGSLAGVEGRIQTGSYEGQDGKRVYTTDVVADSVQFLDRKSDERNASGTSSSETHQSSSQQQPTSPQSYREPVGVGSNASSDPFSNSGPIEVSDDDLPF